MVKLSPRLDISFTKLFGVDENKDLLISLINSIVSKEDQVAEVMLLNPYNLQNFKVDDLARLDIKAKSVDGQMFNIEIQLSNDASTKLYDKRALYYWAKLYTEQLRESKGYSTLSKAIGIHILDYTCIPSVKKYHNVFRVVEIESGFIGFKNFELHTIELDKFTDNPNEELSDILKKVQTSLDMWTAFLTRDDLLNKNNLPKELDNVALKKALTVLDVMTLTPKEKANYDAQIGWLCLKADILKKQLEKGMEKGMEKGRKEIKISTAKKMLLNNEPIEKIIKYTKLSKSQIENLKT